MKKKLVVLVIMLMVLCSAVVHAQNNQQPMWQQLTGGSFGNQQQEEEQEEQQEEEGEEPEDRELTESPGNQGPTTGWLFGAVQFPRGYRPPNYGAQYTAASRPVAGWNALSAAGWDGIGTAWTNFYGEEDAPNPITEEKLSNYFFNTMNPEQRAAFVELEDINGQIQPTRNNEPEDIARRFVQNELTNDQRAAAEAFQEKWNTLGPNDEIPTISDLGWDDKTLEVFGLPADFPEDAKVEVIVDEQGVPLIKVGENEPVEVATIRHKVAEIDRDRQARAYFRANFNVQTGQRAASALNSMIGLDWQQWRSDFAFVFESDVWAATFDQAEAICRANNRLTEDGVSESGNAITDSSVVGRGPSGRPTAIVHVEGIRMSVDKVNGSTGEPFTEYVYRLTPKVVNPSKGADGLFANDKTKSYKFNLFLSNEEGERKQLFPDPVYVSEGETWSRTGNGALFGQSKKRFTEICIEFVGEESHIFDPDTGRVEFPLDLNNRFVKEFCRGIVEQRVSTAGLGSGSTGGGSSNGGGGSSDDPPSDNGQNQQASFS